MLRYHMAVVTKDNALKRAVKRVTTATGSTADFVRDSRELDRSRAFDLAIFDARYEPPNKDFLAAMPPQAKLVHILDGDGLVDRLALLKDKRTASLLCHDDRFDDDEFIASATKALRGEVFGLQKYFPWGVTTFSMLIKNADEKGRAIEILMQYAKLAGVRGPVRDRIQLVADELIMNGLYHAPVNEAGRPLFEGKTPRELAQLAEIPAVQVQYGCSGRYFGMSVRDTGGSLTRQRTLEYLFKAKTGKEIETKASGAGLGLVSVLQSVSKLVFNLEPTVSTEVVALFDMELFAKGKVGARSLHIFTAAPPAIDEAHEQAAASPVSSMWRWATFAAAALAVIVALGAAVYMRGKKADPPPTKRELTFQVDLGASTGKTPIQVTVNDKPVERVAPGKFRADSEMSEAKAVIQIEAKGFRPWRHEVVEAKADQHFHVQLKRK